MPERRNQEPARAARRIKNPVLRLWIKTRHHEINDVARGTELAVLALRAAALQQVFKGVAEFLAVRLGEAVHLGEEHGEDGYCPRSRPRWPAWW
jgi:hypothetical protein